MKLPKNYLLGLTRFDRRDVSAIEAQFREAQEDILVRLFGITNFKVMEDGTVVCTFHHKSKDELSEETRTTTLDPKDTPEGNMQRLLNARAEQRWYQRQRDESQAIPVDAGEKALATAEEAAGANA